MTEEHARCRQLALLAARSRSVRSPLSWVCVVSCSAFVSR